MAGMDTVAASVSATFFFMTDVEATDRTEAPVRHRPTSTGAVRMTLAPPPVVPAPSERRRR